MCKMVKLSHRFVQYLLICMFCQLVTPCFGSPEHSGLGVHQERNSKAGIGSAYMFVLYVLISEYGKKLDKQVKCPVYCAIDHKHRYEEKESHIQRTDRIPGPDKPGNREQSESDIRPIASAD